MLVRIEAGEVAKHLQKHVLRKILRRGAIAQHARCDSEHARLVKTDQGGEGAGFPGARPREQRFGFAWLKALQCVSART